MFKFKKKGFISFIALILAMIVGYFCVNLMCLSNTNTIGVYVKKTLDKANLAAISCARYNDEEAESYIVAEDAVAQFALLTGKNFGLKTPLTLKPFREYNGKYILYRTDGYVDVPDNRTILSKTPNILFGVFNYEDLVGSDRANNNAISENEKINEYRLLIKAIISETRFVDNNNVQNKLIQDTLLKNLFPEDYNSKAPQTIKTTKPITIALAEIPIENSAFNVKTIYRFSLGRLNVYNCQHIYLSDCATTCYKCGKVRIAPNPHTQKFPCSKTCSVCGEKVSGAIPHESGMSEANYPCGKTIRCIHCNSIMVGNTSHNLGAWTNHSKATCTENGVQRAYCQRAGCTYYDERISEYAKGHTFISATCSSPLHCSKCGYKIENSELPHTFTEWKTTKEANCKENGERSRTCKVCGYKEISYINPTNHIWGTPVIVKQATHSAPGILEQSCSICHSVKQTEIPKL